MEPLQYRVTLKAGCKCKARDNAWPRLWMKESFKQDGTTVQSVGMEKLCTSISLNLDDESGLDDSKSQSVSRSVLVIKRDAFQSSLGTLDAFSLYTKKDHSLKDPLHWTTLHELHSPGCFIRDSSRMHFYLKLAEDVAQGLGIRTLKLFDAATISNSEGLYPLSLLTLSKTAQTIYDRQGQTVEPSSEKTYRRIQRSFKAANPEKICLNLDEVDSLIQKVHSEVFQEKKSIESLRTDFQFWHCKHLESCLFLCTLIKARPESWLQSYSDRWKDVY